MEVMDVTDIRYPDQTFDVILCSHVLEHVQDDRKAMRELGRVLKSHGWAILLVPITREVTFEDPTIVNPLERLKAFGLEDHVRAYGRDYVDRLREEGFDVVVSDVSDLAGEIDARRFGLTDACGEIHLCRRHVSEG
jgi:SAM-dependent methyltransferase